MIKKYFVGFAVIVLAIISAFLIYKKLNSKKLPPYLVEAVGRVDGDLINLNTKYPGRVEYISKDTGDKIKKDEVLAKLSSKEYQERLKAVEYEIKAKEKELIFTSSKIENSIKKAKAALEAKKDELKALEAEISSLKEVIKQDIKDEKRIEKLVKKNLAKEHELELARLKTVTDRHKLSALQAKKEALKKAVAVAQAEYNTALAARENIKALQNAVNALRAKKEEIKTVISELEIKSPVNGFVDTKVAHKGEVLGAGMPVMMVIDPNSYYVKIYVDELTNGKIKIGQKAEIFLDSFPNNPIPAVVSKVAKRAEFTPKEVAVRSDRITRVYEVRLKPLKPSPYLKLGLPAIGVILIGEGELPKSLEEIPVI